MLNAKKKVFYDVKVDRSKKEVRFNVGGQPTLEEVEDFVASYKRTEKSIVTSEYSLILDCEFLQVVPVPMLPNLEACFQLYKNSGFEKVIFNLPDNAILKMQISRISRKYNLDNAEIVIKFPNNSLFR